MLRQGVLILALGLAGPMAGQVSEFQAAALAKAAAAAMERERIPALSVAVWAGAGPVWARAWGLADVENFVPATVDSVFRIGSISKPLTAVAALQLAEQGRLDLEAGIQAYVPEFPRQPWPVTLRLLLCHQAGIRNYKGDEFSSTRHYNGVRESLPVFAGDPLVHEPGTRFLYTTYGFCLAGAALESAAGAPFAELIRRQILAPAGMGATRPDDVYQIVPYRVRGYRKRPGGELENCALADTSNKLPGGGWVSTAADLIRFAEALMEGRLLSRAGVEKMWTPQPLEDGGQTGYGLGWGIARRGRFRVIEHSGSQQGARTHLLLAPEGGVAVAVLANLEDADAPGLARQMLDILLKEKE